LIGSAALVAVVLAFAGCSNPSGGGDPSPLEFSVSGSFTKSGGAGSGTVKFKVASDAASSKSIIGRAITAESYAIIGVLEDGALTIGLSGSYDPTTGNWSVSAKSTNIIYTLNGNVDSEGFSQGCSAAIAVKSGNEWVPYFFTVTEGDVTITDEDDAEESDESDLPSFALGYWHSTSSDGYGYLSLGVLVGAWKADVRGTYTNEYGTQPINQNWTVLEFEDEGNNSYGVIACYPEYVMTSTNFASALSAYLGVSVKGCSTMEEFYTYTGTGWAVYVEGDSTQSHSISIKMPEGSSTGSTKLSVFLATGGWEKWAAENSISQANRYTKARMKYTGQTKFEMNQLVRIADPSEPWDQTYTFGSLAALKAVEASLVPEHNWMWETETPEDLGVNTMTFKR
jgi:hypothetical protein